MHLEIPDNDHWDCGALNISDLITQAINLKEDDDMGLPQATIDYLNGQRAAANDFFSVPPQTPKKKNRPDPKTNGHGADGYDSEWAKLVKATDTP